MNEGLSLRSLSVGALLGVVFAGAGTYVGHKTGIIDGGNIPASILAFGILSAVLARRPSIHDGAVAQTVSSSSAMMVITGGLLGPVAALWLGGATPPLYLVIIWGIAVGVVGCLLAIPLRDTFIVRGTLPFPSGAATGEVLQTLYSGRVTSHLKMLAIGGVLAFAFAFARSYLHWIPEDYSLPIMLGTVPAAAIGLGVSWSPLLAGLGFLAGGRVAISLVVGAVLAWVVIGPRLCAAGIAEPDYISQLNWLLWPGTGLMLGGSLGGAAGALRGMRAGLREVSAGDGLRLTRRHVLALVVASGAVIAFGAITFDVHPLILAFGLVLSVLLCAAAARAQGETDNTPAGPMGGFAQVVVGAVAPGGIDAPLSAGGVVNGTLMHSSNMLQNWKTGEITRTPPRTLLVAQLLGVVVGAFACAGAFLLITSAYGLGNETMPAVAALSWKATAEIVKNGVASMPAYAPLAAGIALVVGIVLGLRPIAKYAPSPVAMGMAFILAFYTSFTLALGGLLYWVVARRSKAFADEQGIALACGVVAGEALAGLVVAALIVAGLA